MCIRDSFKIIQGSEGELAEWIQERKVDIGFLSYQAEQRYQFLPVTVSYTHLV